MTQRQRDRIRRLRRLRRNRPREWRRRMRKWGWTLAPVVALNVAPWLLTYPETATRPCLKFAQDYEGVWFRVADREIPEWGTREPYTCIGWRHG